ncbi:MAG: hypothetical protein ABI480_05885 [Chitinophagaceae bacterium]
MKWWAIIGFIFVVLWVCKVIWVLFSITDRVKDEFTYFKNQGIRQFQTDAGENETM